MSHSKTGRKNNWKAVTQQKSIQPGEKDSSSYLVCHFPKQRLTLCLCFSVVLLLRYSMHCLTGSSTYLLSALDTMCHSMMSVSKQFLRVCQIPKESEGVCGKWSQNLLIWHGMTLKGNWKMDTKLYWCCIWIKSSKVRKFDNDWKLLFYYVFYLKFNFKGNRVRQLLCIDSQIIVHNQ